jgi:hypothetical protein
VRVRLEASSSADLLRLWKENDRDRYSEEAFQAARLILLDRGLTPPPQDEWPGRVPVAKKATGLDPTSDEFWMAWLRPLLWISMAIAVVRCLYLMTWVAEMAQTEATYSLPSIYSFTSLVEAIQSVLDVLLPPVLLAGAVLGLQRLRIGRRVLLAWGWTEAASCTVATLHYAVLTAFAANSVLNWAAWALYEAIGNVTLGGYALLILFFITRPQIVRLFEPTTPGFDLSDSEAPAHEHATER